MAKALVLLGCYEQIFIAFLVYKWPFVLSQISRYDASGGKQTFTDLDYIAQTPDWAVYGDSNRGFDPKETRFYRKKCKNLSGC